jgi:hypothetical protein
MIGGRGGEEGWAIWDQIWRDELAMGNDGGEEAAVLMTMTILWMNNDEEA